MRPGSLQENNSQRCAGGAVARRYRRLRVVDGDLSGRRLDARRAGAAARPGPGCRDAARPTSSRSGCATRSAPAGSSAASGCRPPGRSPRSSASRAAWSSTRTRSSSRRATSGRRRAPAPWSPRAAGTTGRPSRPRAAPDRGSTSTSSTASPTCAASRCATGSGPWAWRGGPRPPPTSATSSARVRPQLREVLAAYLRRVRGAVADPDAVVVCAGFRYGLNLVLRALLAEGVTTAAVEDPGPVDHDAIARRSGLRVVPVPVDEHGLDVAALARTPARVVVVTPAHQAPTGVVLAPERRQQLVEWAHARGRVRHRGRLRRRVPLRPPAGRRRAGAGAGPGGRDGLDQQDAVADAADGLAGLPAAAARRRSASRSSCSAAALPGSTSWRSPRSIESGRYDRHLRQMRGVYRSRREVLVDGARPVCAGRRRDRAGRRLPCGPAAAGPVSPRRTRSTACAREFRRRVRHEPLPQRPGAPSRPSWSSGSATSRRAPSLDAVRRVGPVLRRRNYSTCCPVVVPVVATTQHVR